MMRVGGPPADGAPVLGVKLGRVLLPPPPKLINFSSWNRNYSRGRVCGSRGGRPQLMV